MHRITGLDQLDDLFAVTVDQGNLAVIAQCHRKQVGQVELAQLPGRTILGFDQHFPGFQRFGHAPFRWRRRRVLNELGHVRDLIFGQRIGRSPIRHACGRSIGNQRLQEGLPAGLGDVRRQGFPGGTFAQNAMAAGAALEVDFLGCVELGLAHVGRAGGFGHGRVGRCSGGFIGSGRMCHRKGQCRTQCGDSQSKRFSIADQHSISPQARPLRCA
ncbi:hypothetical protein D3C78_985690 [compost metagenome]